MRCLSSVSLFFFRKAKGCWLPLSPLPSFLLPEGTHLRKKENEVLFLFSFLSHLKHCPCEFLKFPAICTQEKEGEREGDRQRARDQVKQWGCCSHSDSGAGKLPMQLFLLPFQCPWDGYCPGHLQQKVPNGIILNQRVWLVEDPEFKLILFFFFF